MPPLAQPIATPLDELRDRAERQLNAVRFGVLALLAVAAIAYAPALTARIRWVNVTILVVTLGWTTWQYVLWYRQDRLPRWLALANPVVDVTAITASMAGYALTQSAALALKAPMFLVYFAVLAARPVTSSPRVAAAIAGLTVVEYGTLVAFVIATGRVAITASPLFAAMGAGISPLDESAKLLLLAIAGAIAVYATAWHERLGLRYDETARAQQRLEIELARAELQRLKHQLHPHFLFNALNAITALIRPDPPAAERTVSALGALLRLSLDTPVDHEVSLERELQLLGHYLDIQRIRFEDRLTIHVAADPSLHGALVPSLILQPLVENAIKHGIGPKADGGTIDVRAVRFGGWLSLCVSDDGVGAPAMPSSEGVGLRNTRARLQYLYGESHRVRVMTGPNAGYTVTIELPFHT
ncbi:MAG TPA: histidine kinase [Gemmatimonadaceae bacterium]|nr:histidine kinase [Gemmatimonadaceae bacterium]